LEVPKYFMKEVVGNESCGMQSHKVKNIALKSFYLEENESNALIKLIFKVGEMSQKLVKALSVKEWEA
jgi:hypothetical protein